MIQYLNSNISRVDQTSHTSQYRIKKTFFPMACIISQQSFGGQNVFVGRYLSTVWCVPIGEDFKLIGIRQSSIIQWACQRKGKQWL